MPNREFKGMIIKILTGIEKRVDDISETLMKDIGNIFKTQSDMKSTMHYIKNTLDGMNIKLDKVEEQISDLEDRVMQSNQAE